MQQPVQPVMENAQPEDPMDEEPVMEEPIIEENKEQEQETLWLCFSFRWELEEFLTRPDALEIRHACMQRIQKHDKWGLVNDETYHPLLKVRSELDSETRSNLARDDQYDV